MIYISGNNSAPFDIVGRAVVIAGPTVVSGVLAFTGYFLIASSDVDLGSVEYLASMLVDIDPVTGPVTINAPNLKRICGSAGILVQSVSTTIINNLPAYDGSPLGMLHIEAFSGASVNFGVPPRSPFVITGLLAIPGLDPHTPIASLTLSGNAPIS